MLISAGQQDLEELKEKKEKLEDSDEHGYVKSKGSGITFFLIKLHCGLNVYMTPLSANYT